MPSRRPRPAPTESADIPQHVVWSLILPYVGNPLPERLSKPSRDKLRQPDLASLSRVSKLFHEICRPLLYHTVVTDDLPLLLSQTELFSIRGNLAHTRHLFVEYSDKTFYTTYGELCQLGREKWDEIGLSPRAARLQVLAAAKAEVDGLKECLEKVNNLWDGEAMRWIFPKLETVAVGAILGTSYDDLGIQRAERPLLTDPMTCVGAFDIFCNSGGLKHLCIRDAVGPLSLATLTFASSYPSDFPQKKYTRTVHLPYLPQHLPIPLGRKVRYVSDTSPTLDYSPTVRALATWMGKVSSLRKREMGRGHQDSQDTVNIEIYSSAKCIRAPPLHPTGAMVQLGDPSYPLRPMSAAEQTKMCGQLRKIMQDQFRRDSGLQDVVTWRRADEQGVCPACGSSPPL